MRTSWLLLRVSCGLDRFGIFQQPARVSSPTCTGSAIERGHIGVPVAELGLAPAAMPLPGYLRSLIAPVTAPCCGVCADGVSIVQKQQVAVLALGRGGNLIWQQPSDPRRRPSQEGTGQSVGPTPFGATYRANLPRFFSARRADLRRSVDRDAMQ